MNSGWGEHPMVSAPGPAYRHGVKRKKISGEKNLKADGASLPAAAGAAATRSYSSPVNPGGLQGHEVRHWLAGEAQMRAERKLAGEPGLDGK